MRSFYLEESSGRQRTLGKGVALSSLKDEVSASAKRLRSAEPRST